MTTKIQPSNLDETLNYAVNQVSANVIVVDGNDIKTYVDNIWSTANSAVDTAVYALTNNEAANLSYTAANAAFLQANAAFEAANNVAPQVQPSFDTANAAFIKANTLDYVYTTTNNAFEKANSANVLAQQAFDAANGKLSLSGGTITGDLTVIGSLSFTGNATTQIITGNTGQFYGYTSNGFNALYAGLPSGYTLVPNEIAQFTGANNSYVQINFQNLNGGSQGTTDWIATANNGTDTTYYVDLGIAGSGYDNSQPDNSLGTSLYPNDSYLYSQGSAGSPGGNLVVGSTTTNTSVRVIAGGSNSGNVIATFNNSNVNISRPIVFADGTSQNTAAASLSYTQSIFTQANAAFEKANTGGSGSVGAAVYVKTYVWKGALVENVGTLRHYIPVASANVTSINSYLTTPGTTTSTMNIKKNGTTIRTVSFGAGATSNLQSNLSISIAASDYITVDITQSSSASDLYINLIYQG